MANVGSLFVVLGLQASDYQKGLAKATKEAQTATKTISREFASLNLKQAVLGVAAFATAIGYAEKKILDVAGNMQALKISLDTVTKGHGEEWFKKLNDFALELPVSLEDIINSYRRMTAMNLRPTIEQMKTLVDTASALGGGKDVLNGITLALGQIISKGKLMSQEVRQLAERGIPAYEMLKNELGMTAEELEKVGHKVIDGQTAVDALFRGMEKAFGGQSQRMANTYVGQIQLIKNQLTDTQRIAGEIAFPDLIEQLKEINKYVKDNKQAIAEFAGTGIKETIAGLKTIIEYREAVAKAIGIMFGAWAINKLVKFATSIGTIYSALAKLIALAGVGMTAISALGAALTATAYGGYKMGVNIAEGKQSGYGPMGITPGYNYYQSKVIEDAKAVDKAWKAVIISKNEALQPNYQNPLTGTSQELINKLILFKPPVYDYKNQIAAVEKAKTEIIELTTEQQKQILDAQREYEKTKLDLIKDEGRKRLAEIGLWYKEEQDKAKDNATALAIIDKTRGVKLDLYDEWWKEQLDKAADDRKKRFNEIIATQMQQSRELEEASKTKVLEFSRTNRDLNLQNTMTGFPLARAEEANRFKDQQAELQKQFGKSPEYMKLMEGAAEEHKQRMIAIDKDQYAQMKEDSLQFAEYWADNLVFVVEQAGNSFNNIGKMFEQMIKKMIIKAAVMGAINFVTGGAGGFAAGFMEALKIPGFAFGGSVQANKPILVGEKGPEIITPKMSATVIPTHKVIDFVMPKLAAPVIPEMKAPKLAAPVIKIEMPKFKWTELSIPNKMISNNNQTSSVTTDNSKWELHFHDSEGVKKMTGIPDEQFAEQFKRAVRDKKINIRKLA